MNWVTVESCRGIRAGGTTAQVTKDGRGIYLHSGLRVAMGNPKYIRVVRDTETGSYGVTPAVEGETGARRGNSFNCFEMIERLSVKGGDVLGVRHLPDVNVWVLLRPVKVREESCDEAPPRRPGRPRKARDEEE